MTGAVETLKVGDWVRCEDTVGEVGGHSKAWWHGVRGQIVVDASLGPCQQRWTVELPHPEDPSTLLRKIFHPCWLHLAPPPRHLRPGTWSVKWAPEDSIPCMCVDDEYDPYRWCCCTPYPFKEDQGHGEIVLFQKPIDVRPPT